MSLKEIRFVSADELVTIEDYAASLLSGMITLRTLSTFHLSAESKGLLEEDEQETAKTMLWEIKRLLNIYTTQIESILERTELTSADVLSSLSSMVPQVKKRPGKAPKNKE